MEKEAYLYDKLDDKKVKCNVCPRYCVVAPGKVGWCASRINKEGKLYTLIYGEVSSIAADPVEKKPVFHFHPGTKVLSVGTLGCNMRCGHCQNWQIAHVMVAGPKKGRLLGYEERATQYIAPEKLIELAKEYDCQGVSWTYNEPTIWFEYMLDSAKLAKKNDFYTISVTNGYITPEALDELGPYLDCFRVDVKGFTNEVYTKLCKAPDFKPVLEAAIRAKKKWKMHVEVVTNVVPTYNDDDKQLTGIAEWVRDNLGPETPWHVTRFHPYLELKDLDPTPIETLDYARQIGLKAGLKFVYIGNVPGHPGEHTYCPKCKKLLIERVGYILGKYHIKDGKCEFCGEDINLVGG